MAKTAEEVAKVQEKAKEEPWNQKKYNKKNNEN